MHSQAIYVVRCKCHPNLRPPTYGRSGCSVHLMIAGGGRQDLGDGSGEPPLGHGQGLSQCGCQRLLHGSLTGSCIKQRQGVVQGADKNIFRGEFCGCTIIHYTVIEINKHVEYSISV